MDFYSQTVEETLKSLSVKKDQGLSETEVQERTREYGKNQLQEAKKKSLFFKFLEQFNDFMVILLIIAAIVSIGVAIVEKSGDYIDSIIIIAIVILNAVMGIVQENKAEKSLESLKKMSAPTSKVLRVGKVVTVPSADLVPGDIILVEAGDFVPADARIIEHSNLQAEESALTGESLPVHKDETVTLPKNCAIGDRINMLFSSTVITYGRGKAVVTDTGMNTEVGHIANMLMGETDTKTPLQKKLAGLGKILGMVAIAICAVIFIMVSFQSREYLQAFMLSVSLAVAAVPEGLPAIVTIVLAVGVSRMVKKNAIIRKLPAVETLGSTTVICSDKTGTLTQNKMTVVRLADINHIVSFEEYPEDLSNIIEFGSLCNDSMVQRDGGFFHVLGDPTETAIVYAGEKINKPKDRLDTKYERIADLPFDSNRKLMSTIHKTNRGYLVVVKGAIDVIFKKCISVNNNGQEVKMTNAYHENIRRFNSEMADEALRVLGVAYKYLDNLPNSITYDTIENDLVFLGLIGMIDPPRPEVFSAVKECKDAGITPIMITGDHKATAVAIASRLGILKKGNLALSGDELDQMPEKEFKENINDIRVYARVSPEHKVKIVKAFKEKGNVVAMTGDGVNDAPALKTADIGCAMGITGTDVAKGAADMVLTDDNFATIVSAVSEGRGVYENIKKTVCFLLSSNIGEIFTLFICILIGLGSPLLPIHLLWINLITDSLPAIALGVDTIDKDIMKRKPIDSKKGIFSGITGIVLVLEGLMIGSLTLAAYVLGGAHHEPVAMTMAFTTLSLSQLVHSFNLRSNKSLFDIGFFTNKYLVGANIISLAVMVIVVEVGPLAKIFKLAPMDLGHWFVVICLSLIPFIAVEIVKFIRNIVLKRMIFLWQRKRP